MDQIQALDLLAGQPQTSASEPEIDLLAYLPLVKSIAFGIFTRIPSYAMVDLNDLLQAGLLGLVHAGKSYCSLRRVPFSVYARFRIRGEIIDTLRQCDFASRGVRRLDRRIKAIQAELLSTLHREPTESEIADSLGPALNRKGGPNQPALYRLPSITLTSLDHDPTEAIACQTCEPSPDSFRSAEEARQILDEAIARLPARSRELIRLYYHGDLTMRQIGQQFQVNESRVSQIHRRALDRLARHLRAAGIESTRQI